MGIFCGFLTYKNLYDDKDLIRGYGKVVMSVIVKQVQVYTVYISNEAKHCNERGHHVCKFSGCVIHLT